MSLRDELEQYIEIKSIGYHLPCPLGPDFIKQSEPNSIK